ncbi:MAG: hypothetical protein ACRDRL_26105, partial [Sciscionella sp.]
MIDEPHAPCAAGPNPVSDTASVSCGRELAVVLRQVEWLCADLAHELPVGHVAPVRARLAADLLGEVSGLLRRCAHEVVSS